MMVRIPDPFTALSAPLIEQSDPMPCEGCGKDATRFDGEEFDTSGRLLCGNCADAANEQRVESFWGMNA